MKVDCKLNHNSRPAQFYCEGDVICSNSLRIFYVVAFLDGVKILVPLNNIHANVLEAHRCSDSYIKAPKGTTFTVE